MRWVSTRVLPEPAPATISSGPSACTTASSCSGLRSGAAPSARGEAAGMAFPSYGRGGNSPRAPNALRCKDARPWRCTWPQCGKRSPTRCPTRRRWSTATTAARGRSTTDRAARLAGALTDAGLGPDSKVGPVPLQLERVPRSATRRVQAARRPGERELPLPRRRALVPARQRRRRGALLPHVARRPGRPRARAPARSCKLLVEVDDGGAGTSTERSATRTSRRPRPDAPHRAPRGRHLHALHRRHDRHAQGRDVRAWAASPSNFVTLGYAAIGLPRPTDAAQIAPRS